MLKIIWIQSWWAGGQLRGVIKCFPILHGLNIGQVQEVQLILMLHFLCVLLDDQRARLTHVRSHMEVQMTTLLESPSANRAFEWLDIRMCAHMLT